MNVYKICVINKKLITKISKIFSKIIIPGSTCFLIGNIGIGKTFFVKGFLGFLIKYKNIVKSPTFSLTENYLIFDLFVYHSDIYRLIEKKKIIGMEILNYKKKNSILIIEWGNLAKEIIKSDIDINIYNYTNFLNRFFFIKLNFLNMILLFGK